MACLSLCSALLQAPRPPPLFASGGSRGGDPGAAAAAKHLAGRAAPGTGGTAQKRFLKRGLAGDATAPAERSAASSAGQQQWQRAQQQGRWGEAPSGRPAARDTAAVSGAADVAGAEDGGGSPPMPSQRPVILNPMARSAHPASPRASPALPAAPAGQDVGAPGALRRGALPAQQQVRCLLWNRALLLDWGSRWRVWLCMAARCEWGWPL